jgi:hypothetical protein
MTRDSDTHDDEIDRRLVAAVLVVAVIRSEPPVGETAMAE